MIIITAEPNDIHALTVAKRLMDLGQDCCILNPEDFPTRCGMGLTYSGDRYDYAIHYGGATIRSETVTGLWLRRFRAYQIDPAVTNEEVRRFAYEECREFFQGWVATVDNVINSSIHEVTALRKLHQLRLAQEVGLAVPRTIVGNDPKEIARFCEANPAETVYKALSSIAFGFYGTQLVTREKMARLDACAYAPTIFQERVPVGQNLRVTVVDDEVYAAEIQVQEQGDLDWRLDMTPVVTAVELPAATSDRLLALQRRLGLRYGAIDLIRRPDGEYVFLEVNPGGQFLFVEIATGLPISAAIARALAPQALAAAA